MTSATIKIYFSDDVEFFTLYVGSDANPDRISSLLKQFCKVNDDLMLENRLNWDYVATNFIRFMQESYHKGIGRGNRVRLTIKEEGVIYNYKLIPNKELYRDKSVPMNEALNLILL